LPGLCLRMVGGFQQEVKVREYHDQIKEDESGRRFFRAKAGRWERLEDIQFV